VDERGLTLRLGLHSPSLECLISTLVWKSLHLQARHGQEAHSTQASRTKEVQTS
jgi:hypothetical protein